MKLKNDLNATKDKNRRIEIRKARNEALNNIHKLLKKEEEEKINKIMEEIEGTKDDSTKMYKAE